MACAVSTKIIIMACVVLLIACLSFCTIIVEHSTFFLLRKIELFYSTKWIYTSVSKKGSTASCKN